MKLLLDLGNTRLKWALHDNGATLAHGAGSWNETLPAALAHDWEGLPCPADVVGASVVSPDHESRVAAVCEGLFGLAPQWLRTPAAACGVRVAYAEPARLGVDRFLAMVAAHADELGDCVLVGVGTALTLDALRADGIHLGGLIAPAPPLMRQSLLGATAQVRPDRAGAIVELADNTADALTSGCWLAAAALVERFVAHTAQRFGRTPVLRLGGGDAALLASLLTSRAEQVEDGVLRGLGIWATSADAQLQQRG